ncbi:right-handed parallel beta-helix repeat-containing protein [Candidatus Latescibacterota bacterium]
MKKHMCFTGAFFLSLFVYIQGIVTAAPLPVTMPDGNAFAFWENTTQYTHTYYVDQNHPRASDTNPGSPDAPFLTINRAAQVVNAGERVLIRSGVYREKVAPKNSGSGLDGMISYEAAPGARVIIKGSEILEDEWFRSRNPEQYSEKLWMITLDESLFPEESPFKIQNASAEDIEIMPWAEQWSGRVPYTLSRGIVFQDGKRLVQLAVYEDLVRVPGSFWVDETGDVIHIHPYDGKEPNQCVMEVTVMPHILKPDVTDLGYIQVKGLTFMHAGNGFPRTGVGALFTMGGHHWIIDGNRFEGINSVAVEIGARSIETSDREISRTDSRRASKYLGGTIVRNNVISDCGTGGIEGYVNRDVLVECNHIYDIGWQDVERYYECGAVKLLSATGTLIQRNLIHDVEAAYGIWVDWDNKYSRISRNTLYDLSITGNGVLYFEASQFPNMYDNNIIWSVHGTAIFGGDSDSLIVANNLIGECDNIGVYTLKITDRSVNGRPTTSRHSRVYNNLFHLERPIEFGDIENISDNNVFSADFNLADLQAGGYDHNSKLLDFTITLDRENVCLRIESKSPVPVFENEPLAEYDFYGNPRVKSVTAGPFQDRFAHPVILNIDPRK